MYSIFFLSCYVFLCLTEKKGMSLQQPHHCSTVLTLLSVSLFLLIDLTLITIFLPLLVFASRLQNGTEYPYSCGISLCEPCRTFWGCIATWDVIKWILFELCPGRPKATLGLGIINSSPMLKQQITSWLLYQGSDVLGGLLLVLGSEVCSVFLVDLSTSERSFLFF